MQSDRELLELAAKAAGLEYHWVKVDGGSLMQASEPGSRSEESWNPLTDDGDALRLAVKLCITDLKLAVGALVFAEGFQEDKYAATRRAIVRAAAELAQAHPDHKDGGAVYE
ncbi:hypothetical protein LMG26685_02153 [Achromobacter mucicolens]|uniref:hypothetical protein n=1 Tax=Achromobacter mucicolens TaxID=1389922 RepID=UPI000B920891|nr:hypothetical protein [Achromobacter mucicolens]OXC91351.1 hypothetical protein BMR85_009570 [Achromobacter sp. KAs 3-5]CAB3643339.1 hypothetical protein LMG26685_02153 [Achromobacter mucicolens]